MRFPYQGYPVQGIGTTRIATVYRPAALIRVIGPVGDSLAYGLLDTGADDTLLPSHFMQPLGVRLEPGARATVAGIGGSAIQVDFARIEFELRQGRTAYRWSTVVGFYNGFRTILGQSGFFEHFLASFNHRERRVTLRPYDSDSAVRRSPARRDQ